MLTLAPWVVILLSDFKSSRVGYQLAQKKGGSKAVAKKSSKAAAPKKAAGKKALAAKPAAKAKSAGKPVTKSSSKSAAKSKAGANASAKSTSKSTGKTLMKAAVAATGLTVAGVALSKVLAPSKATTHVASLFSPLDDRLIVEERKTEMRTPGGLFIPDTVAAPEGPKHGTVLAVGRGHTSKKGNLRPLDVKVGDTVVFESYMGQPLKIGDREVLVMRESQLLGLANS